VRHRAADGRATDGRAADRRGRRPVIAACALVAVVLAACGSERAADDAPGPGQVCRQPGVTPGQVSVGLLYPNTGNAASLFLPFRAGVDARLAVANATGGVNGRKVVYTWRDDASVAAVNLAAARELVDQQDVFGIIESTSVADGSAAFLHSRGVPVTGTSLEDSWLTYSNMFSYSNVIATGRSVSTWGDFVAAHGGRVAVVAQAAFSPTSLSFARELTASLTAAGVRVAGTIDATGPLDLPSLGQKIRASGADVLVGAVTADTFGQVVIAAHTAGVQPRVILSPTGYDQRVLDAFGAALAGAYFFVDYQPFESHAPALTGFTRAMALYEPEWQPANQQAALSGWISADIFLRGLQAAGTCPRRSLFITNLRAVHTYNAGGLLPSPIDFTADFAQLTRCFTFLQVTPDGKRFSVVPPAPLCGSPLRG
jgi:branched-chain amino acid transport system substrate-binding protein